MRSCRRTLLCKVFVPTGFLYKSARKLNREQIHGTKFIRYTMLRRSLSMLSAYSWKDVPYVTEAPHALQALDIAIPRRLPLHAKLPTCVFVHGGAWQRGDKSAGLNKDIDAAFVRAGCLGVTVNYRLSPDVRHPTHVNDVAAAVAWLHGNIAQVGPCVTSRGSGRALTRVWLS